MTAGGGPGVTGTGMQRSNVSVIDKGTIVADVLAASNDGGLIIETSEVGRETKKPHTKVGVRADGAVMSAPNADLSDEERYLVAFMARNFLPGTTVQVGQTWRQEVGGDKSTSDVTTYKVTGIDDQLVHLAVDRVASSRSVKPFDLHMTGTVDYDAKLVVPTSAKLHGILRSQNTQGYTTVTSDIVLAIAEDSFKK